MKFLKNSKIHTAILSKLCNQLINKQEVFHQQNEQEECKYEEEQPIETLQQHAQEQQIVLLQEQQIPDNQKLNETLDAIKLLIVNLEKKDNISPKEKRTLEKLLNKVTLLSVALTTEEKKLFNTEWKEISKSLDACLNMPTLGIFSDSPLGLSSNGDSTTGCIF